LCVGFHCQTFMFTPACSSDLRWGEKLVLPCSVFVAIG
jgi:hypothetical protein